MDEIVILGNCFSSILKDIGGKMTKENGGRRQEDTKKEVVRMFGYSPIKEIEDRHLMYKKTRKAYEEKMIWAARNPFSAQNSKKVHELGDLFTHFEDALGALSTVINNHRERSPQNQNIRRSIIGKFYGHTQFKPDTPPSRQAHGVAREYILLCEAGHEFYNTLVDILIEEGKHLEKHIDKKASEKNVSYWKTLKLYLGSARIANAIGNKEKTIQAIEATEEFIKRYKIDCKFEMIYHKLDSEETWIPNTWGVEMWNNPLTLREDLGYATAET